jgi:uncharacterized membrane protein YqaE (UPF0057 family)
MKILKQLILFTTTATLLYSCASNFASRKHQGLTYIKVQPNNGSDKQLTPNENHTKIQHQEVNREIAQTKSEDKAIVEASTVQQDISVKPVQKHSNKQYIKEQSQQTTEASISVDQPEVKTTQQTKKTAAPDADVMFVLQIIFAFLLPPLAVYLKEQITGRFWLTLILCLLSLFIFFGPFYFGGLWLVAIVIALLVVLDII